MITRGIREFMSRDWQSAREAKDAYWGERVARLGPQESLRVADELRRQMRAKHPDWPRPTDRDDDLQAHIRMADLVHRAGSTRRR